MGLTWQKPLSRAFEQDASLIKRWMEREFPKLLSAGEEGACRHIFQRRERRTVRFFILARPGGYAARPRLLRIPANGFISTCYRPSRPKENLRFMTSRKRISARAVHRFPAATDHELSAKDISGRGWLAGAQSQVGAAVFSGRKRPHQTILPAAIFAWRSIRTQSLVWNDVKNNGVGRAFDPQCTRDLYRAVNSRLRLLPGTIPIRFAPSFRWTPLAFMPPHSL